MIMEASELPIGDLKSQNKTGAGFARGAGFHRGKSNQSYATPPDFRSAVVTRFGMPVFDLAASADNCFGKAYYCEDGDALTKHWHKIDGLLWLNPPFDNIAPWAEKCAAESALGARILFLTPASVGSNWFANHVHQKARVLFLNGSLSFDGKAPYPKDCQLAYYAQLTISTGYEVWKWKEQL